MIQADARTLEALARLLLLDSGPGLQSRLRRIGQPYERFTIPKGSHGRRLIEAPCDELAGLQRRILDQLLYRIPLPMDIHGFVPGRSIVTCARRHLGARTLLNIDLENAFPSVSAARVLDTLTRRLGRHLKQRCPWLDRATRDALLVALTALTTHEDRLPQGAPTSGALLNLALLPLDRTIRAQLRRWREAGVEGLRYSRYADDLTVSSSAELPLEAQRVLCGLIHRAGFRYRAGKVRRFDTARGHTPEVCGLRLDGRQLRIPRQALRRYRASIHRASFEPTLSDVERGRLCGMLGLVHMVYGELPPALAVPWRTLALRHGLPTGVLGQQALQLSGYGGGA